MKKRYYIFLLLNLFWMMGHGQNQNYRFKNLSTAEGLSQSSAIAIKQDKLGQIWIGTRDGLNKYDGNKFTIFRNDPSNDASISNNDILSLEEDQSGQIWIGTYNGLSLYDPTQNTFKNYFHDNSTSSLSNNTVQVIKEMSNGEIWIGTTNGLSIYDKDSDKFTTIFHDPTRSSSISSNEIKSIYEATDGTIWIGTTNGLNKLIDRKGESISFENFRSENNSDQAEGNIIIQDIIEGPNKELLVATNNSYILELDRSQEVLVPFFTETEQKNIGKNIRELLVDNNGALWIGTRYGLHVVEKNGQFTNLINKVGDPNSLSKNSIKSLLKDNKGSIWIGTYYGGINIWDRSNINFINYTVNTGLNFAVVGAIEHDEKNRFYFGTEGKGINILDKKSGESWNISQSNTKGLPGENIKSLLLLNQNHLWIGTAFNGIALYNTTKKKLINELISKELRIYLENTGVYSIKRGNENILWIGTFGKGLVRYDVISKNFISFNKNELDINSLSSDLIRSTIKDHEGNIWVATQNGLNVLNNEDKIKHFFFNDEIGSGNDILTIFQDNRKQIWVGTKSKGLFKYNGLNFDAVELVYKNRKAMAIHGIMENRSDLWLSSNQGLIRFNSTNNNQRFYQLKDGLVGNEFNDNSCLKVDEILYFGGPSGVSSFDPIKIVTNQYAPKVIITDLKIKNASVNSIEDQSILKKTITYTKSLTLTHENGNFSLEFAMPNFINSSSNNYQYRLLGLEDGWNTTTQNAASYTIQNSGNYTFQVKGANNDGIWNNEISTLEIIVLPAPWRSWWAFMIYALLIIFALIILIRFLKSKEKLKHELQFEYLEKERNEEINKAKLQFFTNISHEFRTPLTLISGPLEQLLLNYKGSNQMHKKLLVIQSSANQLLQLINRLMDFRKLENNQFKLDAAEGNIVKFLQEIYLSFSEYAKDGNYNYSFESSEEEILVYYDRPKLERVFFNLLSNAFRFTQKGGDISLHIKTDNGNILISIEDNGVGISEEFKDKIFDRFFELAIHNNVKEKYNNGTGIGLSIAKNIVTLHKGTIKVLKNKNKGTIFQVTLPLGRAHFEDEEILQDFKKSDDLSQYMAQLETKAVDFDDEIEDLVVDPNKHTVLIVEDDKPLRSFIKTLLRNDYNVIEAENGKVGLTNALQFIPDLIISDVIMPEMVGTELCAAIKENIKTSHIPVILLTSRSSLVYKFQGLESGADEYISKPFNVKEFQLKVKNILDSKERIKNKFSREGNLSPSDIAVSSVDEKLLKQAFKIIEDHISNDQFDIPLFSSELGLSRTMLFTKIKAWTNFTPNEFIHEIRMKRAAQLLEQNKINISQISYKVGFPNPKYFSKCFQKKYGKTPSQYKDTFSED